MTCPISSFLLRRRGGGWEVQKPEGLIHPLLLCFFLPDMSDDLASNSEKHKNDVVTAELEIQADTENVYGHDSLDPLYAAKAKILNDSLQEIGMGKYQVRPSLNPGKVLTRSHHQVVSFYRRRLWLVLVRITRFHSISSLTLGVGQR
jgi:hypothetical protein